ncbi:MAG: hypothetical protein ACOYN4_21675 [Bacteroidales bacterium]
MNKLFINRAAVGGFSSPVYWGSSENDDSNAWYQVFVNGYQGTNNKDLTYPVRAVRAF